jgi:hypothetical protein
MGSRTSSFGVGRRQGHDASAFTAADSAKWALDKRVNEIPADMLGKVFENSSEFVRARQHRFVSDGKSAVRLAKTTNR